MKWLKNIAVTALVANHSNPSWYFGKNNCIDMVSRWIQFVFCLRELGQESGFPDCYGLVGKDLMECGKFRMATKCCLLFTVDGYGGGGGAGGGGVLECPALEQMLAVRTPSLMANSQPH